jgi:pimeloyl-ACP methyl ester carboxylesterase
LQLEKPIILGHSMGALTALIFACQYPDVPKAILLEDPPAMWMPSTGADAARAEGIRDWILSLKGKSRDELLEGQRQATPHWSKTELENWADSKVQVSPNVAKIIGTNKDFSGLFRTIECPALLITADPARDAIVTSETAAQLKALVPQLEVVHVAGAGHSIHRDKFDDYIRVVQSFLNGL